MEFKLECFYTSKIWQELKKTKTGKMVAYDFLCDYTKTKNHMFINDDNSVCYDPKNILGKMPCSTKEKLYSVNKGNKFSIVNDGNFLLRKVGSSTAVIDIPLIKNVISENTSNFLFKGRGFTPDMSFIVVLKDSETSKYFIYEISNGTSNSITITTSNGITTTTMNIINNGTISVSYITEKSFFVTYIDSGINLEYVAVYSNDVYSNIFSIEYSGKINKLQLIKSYILAAGGDI